eukprot:gene20216-22193_t
MFWRQISGFFAHCYNDKRRIATAHLVVVLIDRRFHFVGELGNLEASERIRVLQGRIYEVQKLYGKLKTELASMERRKRRKLRKQQVETSWLAKSSDAGEPKPTISR